MKSTLLSLLAVLGGLALIVGGVWGAINSFSSDDDDTSTTTRTSPFAGSHFGSPPRLKEVAHSSLPDECARVARRDPRFRLPRDLTFGTDGTALVNCDGSSVRFSIELRSRVLEPSTFYKIKLEKGRRKEDVGSFLSPPTGFVRQPEPITVGPEVRIRRYDYLTIRKDPFFAHGKALGEPLRAAILPRSSR